MSIQLIVYNSFYFLQLPEAQQEGAVAPPGQPQPQAQPQDGEVRV